MTYIYGMLQGVTLCYVNSTLCPVQFIQMVLFRVLSVSLSLAGLSLPETMSPLINGSSSRELLMLLLLNSGTVQML